MKPNQKKKGTSPGQLKLFWDELDITNEEIGSNNICQGKLLYT